MLAESYPERAKTMFVMKIGSGTKENVPQKVLNILAETPGAGFEVNEQG